MGKSHFATGPVALYGVGLLLRSLRLLAAPALVAQGRRPDCLLARAVGGDWKGNLTPLINAAAPLDLLRALHRGGGNLVLPDPRIEGKIVPAERRLAADY